MKDRELRVMSTEKKSKAQNVSSDKNKQAAPKLKFVLLPSEEAQKVSLDKKKRATPKLKRKQTTGLTPAYPHSLKTSYQKAAAVDGLMKLDSGESSAELIFETIEGVSDRFKKKILELFDKFSTVERSIPAHLKKIKGDKGFGLTYECTKLFEKHRSHRLEGVSREELEDMFDNSAWENFDKYKNNEEVYLKKVANEDCFGYEGSEYYADLCIEGKVLHGRDCILKWSCRCPDYDVGIREGDFGSQYEFYDNLKFSHHYGRGKYGDFRNFYMCITLYDRWIGIDPHFILEKMWRPLIVELGFGDNINCDYDNNGYFDTYVMENIWLAEKFFEKGRGETNPRRRNTYERAARAIYDSVKNINSVQDVKTLKGIGKSSLAFLQELFEKRKNSYFWIKLEEAKNGILLKRQKNIIL